MILAQFTTRGIDQVGARLEQINSAFIDHVLGFGHLHEAAADVVVGTLYRLLHLAQGYVVAGQRVGVDFHLVLLHETAHRGDFRNAGY